MLGSPDWEIKRKGPEHGIVEEKSLHFPYAFFFVRCIRWVIFSIRLLPVGRPLTPHFVDQHKKCNLFQRLGRTPKSSGLRIPPVAHSRSPNQSFFYTLDTPASSTQSSLGNLLPDSTLVRLVSRHSQGRPSELPDYPQKTPTEIPTPAPNPSTSPTGFGLATPEIKSPPKAKRCSLVRKTPPIPPFLPIQTPPDSPILIEPKESFPSGNFTFHLHPPEPPIAHHRISHPYAQSRVDPSTSTVSAFPRSPSQEFHSCDEQSPGQDPGHLSPASPSISPTNHLLGKASPNTKSFSSSLLVNAGGDSPFLASTSGNRGLTIPRQASTSYTEDSLCSQSPSIFNPRSTGAMTGVKLVPFSASARASVISDGPSYTSEHGYQGGISPTVPCELEEYYDYVGSEGAFAVSGGTESPAYRNGHEQAWVPSDLVSYADGSNLEPSTSELERKSSFCVPGPLFSIPEEDTQTESSGPRLRSDPSSSFNGSIRTAAASLPSASSSCGEFAGSSVSTSGSFRATDHSTPGASGAGSRPPDTRTGSTPVTSTPAQIMHRRAIISSTPPPNVGLLRVGGRESYPGSGDLNDGTEVSGACMNGLYEELEEWGCEWILQNQRQPSSSAGRT